jgi:hypothetical protein
MLLASLPATAAILTRQLGIAIPLSVGCVFLLHRREQPVVLPFLAATILPVIAALFQYVLFAPPPGWATLMTGELMRNYYSDPIAVLTNFMLIRPMISLLYLSLFAAPLVICCGITFFQTNASRKKQNLKTEPVNPKDALTARDRKIIAGLLLFLLVALYFHGRWMPLIPWFFNFFSAHGARVAIAYTAILAIGGVLIGRIALLNLFSGAKRTTAELLVDYSTLFFAIITFAFYKMGDKYLVIFLPWMLLAIAKHLSSWLEMRAKWAMALAIVCLCVSSLWVRADMEAEEARWTAGEWLLQQGVRPEEVSAVWTWVAYYRFDEYLSNIERRPISVSDFFNRWLPEQRKTCRYHVLSHVPKQPGWKPLMEFPYHDFFLTRRSYYVLERNTETVR